MSTQSSRRRLALATVLLAGTACDFPQTAPYWEPVFNVPGQTTRITVAELLPAEVTITPDSQAFQVSVGGVSMSHQLSQSCSICASMPNQRIPKPAFAFTIENSTSMPTDLAAATISGSALVVDVANHYGFDPIRPSSDPTAERGYIILEVVNGQAVIARDSLDGSTFALPNDDTTTVTIGLAGTVGGLEPLRVRFTMYSPAGDTVTVRPSGSVQVTARDALLRISNVSVRVETQSITPAPTEIDLSDVDSTAGDRMVRGALLMAVTNPFGIQGTLTASITGGRSGTITKTLALSRNPTSTARIDFTAADLRSILGRTVNLALAGTVSAPLGTVPIAPTQAVIIDTRLELVVTTKEP